MFNCEQFNEEKGDDDDDDVDGGDEEKEIMWYRVDFSSTSTPSSSPTCDARPNQRCAYALFNCANIT